MKHILILTFLLPVICLGQKDSTFTGTGTVENLGVKSIIDTGAPTRPYTGDKWRVGDVYYRADDKGNIKEFVPGWDEKRGYFVPGLRCQQIGHEFDTLEYSSHGKNSIELYCRWCQLRKWEYIEAKTKDSCEHIWVEEYERHGPDPYGTHLVCIKCFKRETQQNLPVPSWLPATLLPERDCIDPGFHQGYIPRLDSNGDILPPFGNGIHIEGDGTAEHPYVH